MGVFPVLSFGRQFFNIDFPGGKIDLADLIEQKIAVFIDRQEFVIGPYRLQLSIGVDQDFPIPDRYVFKCFCLLQVSMSSVASTWIG